MFVHNEHRSISLRASWLPLSALSAVFLVEMLDNSILTVALPTIGRDLAASATALQWVTGSYAVLFGGLMLLFGSLADRFGRRRMMLIGLALLATASAATVLVSTAEQLIALRGLMGIAAAMTTPGSMALAYRLFDEEAARVRAVTVISTVGLIGLAVGPTMGGLVLGVAPWQVLLLVNVPIALYALVGIRAGIGQDAPETLHRAPLDVVGALLATAAIVLALLAPTGFVEVGPRSAPPWGLLGGALAAAGLFWIQERRASHPLIDLALLGSPLVASGLAFKAAAGLATAGLSYLVTLQLQFAWGWPPALAAVGMLPQVVVLLALGPFVNPLVARWGMARAAWVSASAVVLGLALFTGLNRVGYGGVAVALALVAAGLRVIGVVAAITVLDGLPAARTSVGAALTDTVTEVANGAGVAVAGTLIAAFVAGSITAPGWTPQQAAQFEDAVTWGGGALTALAAGLVAYGFARSCQHANPVGAP